MCKQNMRFRPCIDIHNGRVKQIVGGSLRDSAAEELRKDEDSAAAAESTARENFVSEKDAAWYAEFYRERGLSGGHVILLNPAGSPEYEATLEQAKSALAAWPGGLMIGGGVNPENAESFLRAGASHVIVTSYVFREGRIDRKRLEEMVSAVGKEHLVLDLSCRARNTPEDDIMQEGSIRRAGGRYPGEQSRHEEHVGAARAAVSRYYVVTDRWQTFTEERVTPALLAELQDSCDEFLIHAVDVEGKASGIEEGVLEIMAQGSGIPVTYAGGIRSLEDIRRIGQLGGGRVDFTIGSALDLFGGPLKLEDVQKLTAQS